MSSTSNVASCLLNCHKKLGPTLMQRSPPFIASNETMLNVKPVCGSVGVGDGVVGTDFISGVDPQSTAIGFALHVDPYFIEPEYEVTFGDERAEDSAVDRPVPELSNRDKALLQRALVEHAPEMPDCQDLSQAHRVVADGL
jgi:hypothetical protein